MTLLDKCGAQSVRYQTNADFGQISNMLSAIDEEQKKILTNITSP